VFLISEITNEPAQEHTFNIPGRERAVFTIVFRPEQFGWFYSLNWGSFVLNNSRIVFSQNLLRQFKNIIPFGIAVTTNNKLDPLTIDAFSSGVAQLYLLSADEVEDLEETYYG